MTKIEQMQNIDQFTDDLTNAILAEGVARGVSSEQQLAAREAMRALGQAAKNLIGKCPAGLFAYACIAYGEAMEESLIDDSGDSREVYEHIDEGIRTTAGDDDE